MKMPDRRPPTIQKAHSAAERMVMDAKRLYQWAQRHGTPHQIELARKAVDYTNRLLGDF